MIGDKEILGRVYINSKHSPTTIISNLKREIQDYIVQERVKEYWVQHSKAFLIYKEVDLLLFHYTARNIQLQLRK